MLIAPLTEHGTAAMKAPQPAPAAGFPGQAPGAAGMIPGSMRKA